MISDVLERELRYLGVDESSYVVLALLPLVQVAWADGEVQEPERVEILRLADIHYRLPSDARDLLESWLRYPPSETYLLRGRRALVALANHDAEFTLAAGSLEDVVAFSQSIARAAGGLFGYRAVHAEEARVIEQIATLLNASGDVLGLFDEEDVDDDATDLRSADDMRRIREAASIARPTDGQEVPVADAVADLIHHGAQGATSFALTAAGLSIGRSSDNQVQIKHDASVSRVHARLLLEDQGVTLIDNDTTNGTFVNGERVHRRRLLGAEQIRVGDAHFTFLPR